MERERFRARAKYAGENEEDGKLKRWSEGEWFRGRDWDGIVEQNNMHEKYILSRNCGDRLMRSLAVEIDCSCMAAIAWARLADLGIWDA